MTDLDPLLPEEGVERFLNYREPSIVESTYQNETTRLGFFLNWCELRDVNNLNDLSGRDLADFVAWRRNAIKPITLQKQLSTIRQALRWWADIEAVEDGLAEKVHAPELPDGAGARSVHLSGERANEILASLDRYQFASRNHTIVSLFWRTGMRRSEVRAIDVEDLRPDHHAINLKHRPETDTPLKNGESGERWVYLGPKWYSIIDEYLDHPDRYDVQDRYGRQPLVTSKYGRPTGDTFNKWINRVTQPCEIGPCPHDRDPATCEARVGSNQYPARCPSSRSPHALRRGAITYHLNEEVSPETVSERMDVSLEVLYEHYDARTPQEKMDVRKGNLPE
ncbi:tyrosine-type recombinase/integrase [Halogeometricum luteum]|uniref:Site-specific integrase n=1 Tax=Halogeometricum luteum TaxID=2950537 RepID=A0ABU2G6J9_9EURY|nr:tyrosine-type recombinase/integrase [Halogeometricum sp. S3BR5-2]MDS0296418.1 site-specific integrase [Halogeometricum sp. S3BR5-2]